MADKDPPSPVRKGEHPRIGDCGSAPAMTVKACVVLPMSIYTVTPGLRHSVVACAHQHADPAKRRDDEETHAKPKPERLATAAGDHSACVGLDDVGDDYENDD